jgi:SAM-dependent methyltransferase
MSDQSEKLLGFDTSVPNPARMYDYFLSGKDNFPADKAAADKLLEVVPLTRAGARENRAFLQRAVRFLAGDAGIRQFLDIGTGLPTQGNVHEIAQSIAPDARVVYVDNDPVVHVHANALLSGANTATVLEDLRRPDAIIEHPTTQQFIDFDQPVAVLLLAVLHFIRDQEDPAGIVARLKAAMAPGSYLVISHATGDLYPEEVGTLAMKAYDRASAPLVLRTRAEIGDLFDGLELVAPGLSQLSLWRPDGDLQSGRGLFGGVGRKGQ